MERPSVEERSYEQMVHALEACVRDLEEGRLPLEQAIERFKEGVSLVKLAEQRLQTAESQVNLLLRGEEGQDVKQPLAMSSASAEAPRGPRLATSAPSGSFSSPVGAVPRESPRPSEPPKPANRQPQRAADDDIPF